jgi:putative transposase
MDKIGENTQQYKNEYICCYAKSFSWYYCNTPLRSPSQTVGAIIRGFKSAVTKQINVLRQIPGTKLWERNYWGHIVRNETELNRICQYIQNNPQKWNDDKLNDGVGNVVMEQDSQYGYEKWMM